MCVCVCEWECECLYFQSFSWLSMLPWSFLLPVLELGPKSAMHDWEGGEWSLDSITLPSHTLGKISILPAHLEEGDTAASRDYSRQQPRSCSLGPSGCAERRVKWAYRPVDGCLPVAVPVPAVPRDRRATLIDGSANSQALPGSSVTWR